MSQTPPAAKSASRRADSKPRDVRRGRLPTSLRCCHCGHRFAPEDVLWISQHKSLLGDPVLGPDAPLRFRPSRFDLSNQALDARGLACHRLACPRCHLEIPRSLLELPAHFFALVGPPGSGKTAWLASLLAAARKRLPHDFFLDVEEPDIAPPTPVHERERALFLANNPQQPVTLKPTRLGGRQYQRLSLDGVDSRLAHPLLLTLKPRPSHPAANDPKASGMLVFYDASGHQWMPHISEAQRAGSEHLTWADTVLLLVDPTLDLRLRGWCRSDAVGDVEPLRYERVLAEAVRRRQENENIHEPSKLKATLVVVLGKRDLWRAGAVGEPEPVAEPWTEPDPAGKVPAKLRLIEVDRDADRLRAQLQQDLPALVDEADRGFSSVRYVAVSALGSANQAGAAEQVIPERIEPQGVLMPLLDVLVRDAAGLVQAEKTTD